MPPPNSPQATTVVSNVPLVQIASDGDGPVSSKDTKEKPGFLPTGLKCEATNLYLANDGSWTPTYPTYIAEPPENEETDQYALIIRYIKSSDARKKFMIQSIVVQSPYLKKILSSVLDIYPGITTNLDRLEFDAPFEPFVHRWHQLEKARDEEQDPVSKEHVHLLWNILEAELSNTIRTIKDLVSHGVMTYKLLYTVFEPGSLVYSKDDGHEVVMRVSQAYYVSESYSVQCMYIDWDGKGFGTAYASREVPVFRGTTAITNLDVYPLIYHPDRTAFEQRLIARGQIFEAHAGYHFKSYSGIGIDLTVYPRPAKYTLNSRIIIDAEAYNLFNPNNIVYLSAIHDDTSYFGGGSDQEDKNEVEGSGAELCGSGSQRSLSKYQLLISAPYVRGYAIGDKKWLKFWIDSIQEIVWNDHAFDSLVIPTKTKDLILAFAESQVKYEQRFDDVIQGKGKGIIMLLSGPPGVGKTLTAESVAETMRVPLYMMSAGDLGEDPRGVETALRDILSLTTKWKAVLLLDECDVFLEARSKHDLERNKLVSIFLRVLEYFEGFLFLTSNRVDDIDTAFESRIHLSLYYSELSVDSRRQVWETFLRGAKALDNFSEAELASLAGLEMNGRQIKNTLKTAQLLATRANVPLKFGHVDVVAKLRAAHRDRVPLKGTGR